MQVTFWGRLFTEEVTCQDVVLIPKGGRYVWEVGLIEVIWKMVSFILDHCLGANIAFHDILYGFRDGCRIETASLKANLLQHLISMVKEVH